MRTTDKRRPPSAARAALYGSGNARQSEAIHHYRGPCLVLAGPGSGKTYVIARRILNLIESHHVSPERILVLTFSNAAAREMKQRFRKLSDEYASLRETGRNNSEGACTPGHQKSSDVQFGTFHSVFYHILCMTAGQEFRLLDPDARAMLLKSLLERHPALRNEYTDLQELERRIAAWKVQRALQEPSISRSGSGRISGSVSSEQDISEQEMRKLTDEYQEYLRQTSRIDYDDMILRTLEMLRGDPALAGLWQKNWDFILIDEFQDISAAQYELIRLLTNGNLFAVGDDDQSIYGFRGSSPKLMQRFLKEYHPRRIILDINYRCSPAILASSAKVISENRDRIPKAVRPAARLLRDPSFSENIHVLGFEEDPMQYRYIAEEIKKALGSGRASAGDFAVIVRTRKQVQLAARILDGQHVPLSIRIPEDHALETEILDDIIAYFSIPAKIKGSGNMMYGSVDEIPAGLLRILNRPERYILQGDLLYSGRKHRPVPSLKILERDLKRMGSLGPAHAYSYLRYGMQYENFLLGIHEKEQDRVKAVLDRIREESESSKDLSGLSKRLQIMRQDLHKKDIRVTAGIAAEKPGPVYGSGKNAGSAPPSDATQGVHILTMHAAKGLEFDSVYIPDLNEGMMPLRACTSAQESLEEERRLLYVAMTRARRHLTLLYTCGTRTSPVKPSRFLKVLGVHEWDYMVK